MIPKVSIIIPAYNIEKYIGETIQSVIDQTYSNWELIVVNDGSTDNTNKIIETYCQIDNRIKLINKKNEGVSIARNTGYKLANGNYLAFLDADDKWHKENLSQKLIILQANIEVGLVHADMQHIDENSVIQKECYSGKEGNILKSLLLWDGANIPSPSSILVRREVMENVGLFDAELSTAADQEFFFRVASRYKVARIPRVLGFYRFHSANMHKNVALMERDHHLAYLKAKNNNLFHSFWFQKRCFSNLFLIIAASWWIPDKKRSVKFFIKAFCSYPVNIITVFKKLYLKFERYFSRGQILAHFKIFIFGILKIIGVLNLLRFLKKKDELTVLLFHRITDEKLVSWEPMTPLLFEKIIIYIIKHYEVVSIDDALSQNTTKKRKLVLTFDDGYKDFYHTALPILKKYNLPVVVNIVTSPLINNVPIWSQRINDLIELYYKSDYRLSFSINENKYSYSINNSNVFKISNQLFNLFIKINTADREQILFEMERNCPKVIIRSSYMSRKEITEASKSNILIGNHSFSHCNVNDLITKDDFDKEFVASKKFIEELTKMENDIFAFPNGLFNNESVRKIESYGFKKLFIVGEHTSIPAVDSKIHIIPRKSLYYQSFIENQFKIEGFHSTINRIFRPKYGRE